MNDDIQVILFSGLAISMWGLWGFWGKMALAKGMTPLSLFLLEILPGALCGVGVLITCIYCLSYNNSCMVWNNYGLLSGVGLNFGLIFYYMALSKGQASLVVSLTAIYPLVSVLLGFTILHEKLTPLQWGGVVLVIIGTICIVSGPFIASSN